MEARRKTMQFTITDLWHHMGLFARAIVFVLVIMSFTSLVVAIERWVVFGRSKSESKSFAQKMAGILAKGDLQAASSTNVGKKVGHLGRVIGAGLTAYRLSNPNNRDAAVESIARALERQGQREVQSFKRGLGMLATVGSTTPFVGMSGTVLGIVNSFQSMVTTAFGLLVAIPAVMFYNVLQGWVDARAVDIAESANEFLDVVNKQLGAH